MLKQVFPRGWGAADLEAMCDAGCPDAKSFAATTKELDQCVKDINHLTRLLEPCQTVMADPKATEAKRQKAVLQLALLSPQLARLKHYRGKLIEVLDAWHAKEREAVRGVAGEAA